MRTTTHHGWPVAEGTDPAKQYPATVDGPFKDALDASLVAMDTGWRNIAGLLVNGFIQYGSPANYPVSIRRAGHIVYLSGLTTNNAAQIANTVILNAPLGFRPKYAVFWAAALEVAAPFNLTAQADGSVTIGTAFSATTKFLSLSHAWPTDDVWPSTLPGTPAVA
jgi:hypothetical protein